MKHILIFFLLTPLLSYSQIIDIETRGNCCAAKYEACVNGGGSPQYCIIDYQCCNELFNRQGSNIKNVEYVLSVDDMSESGVITINIPGTPILILCYGMDPSRSSIGSYGVSNSTSNTCYYIRDDGKTFLNDGIAGKVLLESNGWKWGNTNFARGSFDCNLVKAGAGLDIQIKFYITYAL